MTDEQIEQAAEEYAEPTRVYLLGEETRLIKEAFKAGAHFTLSHQWVSVDERLPEENEEVLCMMESNGAVVSGFIFKNRYGFPQVSTSPDFHFEDHGGYEPTHWMHKPQLKPEKKKDDTHSSIHNQ